MRRIVGLFLLSWSGWLVADCPAYSDLTMVRAEPAVKWVGRTMDRCGDDAVATGLYGGLLLRDRQIGAALVWLEKSLLLDPDQPGVAADYALALASVGESDASSALAQQVLTRTDVPDDLESLLDDIARASFWQHGFQFSVGVGASDNILFEPDLELLELTFGDDGRAQVPLAEPSIPVASGLTQQSVQWSGYFARGETEILPSFDASMRRAGGSALPDYRSLSAELWMRSGVSSLGVGLTEVTFGGDQDRDEWFFGVERTLTQFASCELSAGIEYQKVAYAQPVYDAAVSSVIGQAACAGGWEGRAEIARNQAINARAGGDKAVLSLGVTKVLPIQFGTLQLATQVTQEADSEPYSDFLARGAPRSIDTIRLGVVWEIPLGADWTLSSQATHIRQTSNINLFEVTGSEIVINMIYIP